MKRILIISIGILILGSSMLAVALYIPNSLPVDSDFLAIYNADLALVNRVPIYDLPAVSVVAREASGIPEEHFFLVRFLYPPWYALSAFYLGYLPVKAAAALWFELNLLMFFLSVWFLTDGWNGRLRLVAFPLALFFAPVLGTLSVGQYDIPVLLGVSMLIYSLRKENITLTTLGAVLLTFKPHIGALMLLCTLILLLRSRSDFGWKTIRAILLTGVFLFLIGFIADPNWVSGYPKVLLNYGESEHVSDCSECTSFPVMLSRWLFDGSFGPSTWVGLVLMLVLIAAFFLQRSSLLKSHELLLCAALLITLLIMPYLYNYNYVLLLAPFAVLNHGTKHLLVKALILLCCLAPMVLIIAYGREGNVSLLVATLTTIILVYWHAKTRVDVPAFASYNTNN